MLALMKRRFFTTLALLALALPYAGCESPPPAAGVEEADVQATVSAAVAGTIAAQPTAAGPATPHTISTPTPTPRPTATATSTPTSTPAPTPTPDPTPIPAKLTPKQIYERIAPSVTIIETPRGQDSGILMKGGYVLTGTFFVHSYETVNVRLLTGDAFSEVPVHSTDLVTGIAIVGPIDVDAAPLEFADDPDAALQGNTYLVGYARLGDGGFKQPSIAPGPVASTLESQVLGLTHYRVSVDHRPIDIGIEGDAVSSPSWWWNSKPLVAEDGAVIGLSGFLRHTEVDTEDSYEYALSSSDVVRRVEDLLSGTGTGGIEATQAPGETEHVVNEPPLVIAPDYKVYVLSQPVGTDVVVGITGSGYSRFAILDGSRRRVSDIYEGEHGNESAKFTVEHEGAYYIEIVQRMDSPMEFHLSSSHPVTEVEDPDDGVFVRPDGRVAGGIDSSNEGDVFHINLEKGQAVRVTLASGSIMPQVRIQFAEEALYFASANAALPNFFEASVIYTARESGEYLIYAENAQQHTGDYVLAVDSLFPLPEGLPIQEVLERVKLTVPLIETPTGRSTGVLLEGGYVLVKRSDIWPHAYARVAFPDGSVHRRVYVHSVDAMANLALLGPMPSYIPALAHGTTDPFGQDLYLVGYPRGEETPLAVVASVSGSIDWTAQELAYLSVDNGHLRGMDWEPGRLLVSEDGSLIGYGAFGWGFAIDNLNLTITRLRYELALQSADVMQRVAPLLTSEGTGNLERWLVPTTGGSTEQPLVPSEAWQTRTYVINEPAGTEVTLLIQGGDDVYYAIFDSLASGDRTVDVFEFPDGTRRQTFGGTAAKVVRLDDGTEVVTFVIEDDAPHFVRIRYSGERTDLRVQGSHVLTFLEDPDDGRSVSKGEQVSGNMEHHLDVDVFLVQLDAGESVRFTVDSISVDPSIAIALSSGTESENLTKRPDDERFWEHEFPPYTAQNTGEYLVYVSGGGTGAYMLSVD
ncbi:MAG: hypothetical protein OXE50_09040 [Chloroflexi bacterium]|nr:hypothetical protein [Chloroflexota bacterium]